VGPTDRGWRRDSLYRGDGEGFLVNGKKGYRESTGEGFLPFHPIYDYSLVLGRG
jgi:hypothetical protein